MKKTLKVTLAVVGLSAVVATSALAYTPIPSLITSNPFWSAPVGHAETSTEVTVAQISAQTYVFNKDGSSNATQEAVAYNSVRAVSQQISGNSYWSKGTTFKGVHKINDANQGNWAHDTYKAY